MQILTPKHGKNSGKFKEKVHWDPKQPNAFVIGTEIQQVKFKKLNQYGFRFIYFKLTKLNLIMICYLDK